MSKSSENEAVKVSANKCQLTDDGASKVADPPSDVAFLYKTMIQRDPNKRKVKPVESHLLQIHFGMSDEDEDDDSDYEFKPSAERASDDEYEEDEEEEDFELNGADKNADHSSTENTEKEEEKHVIKQSGILMRVCSVCLDSTSGEDEIIECDSCGILVHEGCYGVDEPTSVHSDMSQESTEPWFCDSCKAGTTPMCELCPNQFGIYKQTDTGRWVHLICALYVPGVAFGNTQKLTNVTLLEMPYSKWGNKECCLCEDENYTMTGVCIGCDAGMCRSYFHVTCAQREGLLSEASIEEDIADPFYAHCKMHGDKMVTKQKKRSFLTLHNHVRQFRENKERNPLSGHTNRKLQRFIRKFRQAEAKRPAAWVPPHKLPRALTSSAYAVKCLLRKAELLDVQSREPKVAQQNVPSKKTNIAPALTVEFAAYYHHRNQKIESLKKLSGEATKLNKQLEEQENVLRQKLDKVNDNLRDLNASCDKTRKVMSKLLHLLGDFNKKKYSLPKKLLAASSKKSAKITSTRKPTESLILECGICSLTKDQHLLAKCDQCLKHYHLNCLDPPLTRIPKKTKLCGWICSICEQREQKAYTDSLGKKIDTKAPMRLREVIKEPIKFAPPQVQLIVEKSKGTHKAKSKSSRKRLANKEKKGPGRPKKQKPTISDKTEKTTPSPPKSKKLVSSPLSSLPSPRPDDTEEQKINQLQLSKLGRKPKVAESGSCHSCSEECTGNDAVKCDNCCQWYHFCCLKPPVKKSPKVKGYTWHCEQCDSDDDEMNMKNAEVQRDHQE